MNRPRLVAAAAALLNLPLLYLLAWPVPIDPEAWVAPAHDPSAWPIASPRNRALDVAASRPWLRRVMVRLPDRLQPAPERTARILGVDGEGRVVHDLFDPSGAHITMVTSVQERGAWLYVGSLIDTAWVRMPRP